MNTPPDNPSPLVPESTQHHVRLRLFFLLLALAWTLVIAVSLWYNFRQSEDHAFDSARIQARTAFEKDVMYRRWNSRHSGVFVFVTNSTRPNPYLKNPGRDLFTQDDRMLTKINPAFMTRLVHELGASQSGVLGHITSTNPIRDGNEPDDWERQALERIERRETEEVAEYRHIGAGEYLRFIKGLETEPSCVPCHPDYKVGSVRGGISVSVPMEPFRQAVAATNRILFGSHFSIWFIGLCGLAFGTRRLAAGLKERDKAESALRDLTAELETRVVRRTEDLNRRTGELQAIVENADVGVFLKDESGAYITANTRFAGMLGKIPAQVVGHTPYDVLDEDTRKKLEEHEQAVLTADKSLELRHAFTGRSGSAHSCFSFPVHEGDKVVGLGGIVVDMSERDRVEKALLDAKNAAEQASRAKSDFLANMSHEIRTPLNGVIGMADLLLRTRLSPDQASMAAAVKAGGDSLLAVLNDVLDISKIEAGKLSLESTSFLLRDILFESVKGLTPIAYKKNLELILHISPQVPEQVVGDSVRLRQIILNLVNNALKFTDNGEVVVTVLPVSHTDTAVRLRFSVTDTGIGIPQDKQKSIFSAFEQADTSTTRKYGGTGLGLAICSRLLHLMDARLELKSHEGFGSSFWFELELPVDTGAAPPKPLICTEALKGRHVLIVDDNETNLRILQETLMAWGMETRRSTSVDEALALAKVAVGSKRPFALILSDLQMPEKDGVDLLRAVRADVELTHLPIILLTSGNLPNDIQSATGKPGAFDAVLDKPVRPEVLMRAVAAALNIWESYDAQEIERETERELPSGPKLKILLAEDVEMNQMVASRMLAELGHSVVVVGDGRQALEAVCAEPYDLVLMDIQMPVMDGVQATLGIREMERQGVIKNKVRIVAMTANALKGDKDKYLAVGMDGYIAKPILLVDLRAVISGAVDEPAVVPNGRKELEPTWCTLLDATHGNPIKFETDKATAEHFGRPQTASAPPLREAPSRSSAPTPEQAAIDWDMLRRNFAGSEDFIRESMRLYLRDAPKLLQDAMDAVNRTDGAGLTVAAHALKGITGYFSRALPYELAFALEELGRDGSIQQQRAEVGKMLNALSDQLDRLFTEMSAYMENRQG